MGYAQEAMAELHGQNSFSSAIDSTSRKAIGLTPVMQDVIAELAKARATHAPMNGHHEGYAVILEELDELWVECKSNTHAKNTPESERPVLRAAKRLRMRKEALQVAAMAVRFIEDVCDKS